MQESSRSVVLEVWGMKDCKRRRLAASIPVVGAHHRVFLNLGMLRPSSEKRWKYHPDDPDLPKLFLSFLPFITASPISYYQFSFP